MNRHTITPGSIWQSTIGVRHSPLLALRGIEADFGPPAGAGPTPSAATEKCRMTNCILPTSTFKLQPSDFALDPFEEKMPRLVADLHAQFAESHRLEVAIRNNLKGLGFK